MDVWLVRNVVSFLLAEDILPLLAAVACLVLVWRSPDPLTCLHFVDDVIGRQEEGLVDNSTLVVQPTLGGCASTSVIVTH